MRCVPQVQVCLFLISRSTLPLSAGLLALLKRLHAVTSLLPLIIVEQNAPQEQMLREYGRICVTSRAEFYQPMFLRLIWSMALSTVLVVRETMFFYAVGGSLAFNLQRVTW